MTSNAQSRCGKVCVVAPTPPPYGGMSLQAERLVSQLAEEGIEVEVITTNPRPPRWLGSVQKIPGLRTLVREVQYLTLIIRRMPRSQIVHHFSASGLYFFAHSVPVLVLGRWLEKRVILNYRGGNAAAFLKNWGWLAVPFMRLATCIAVPSEFLQSVFGNSGLSTTVLPNLAQTEVFPWRERQHFAPTLLVTRHLEPMYNVECLLRGFRIIQARFPEAVLTVAGDGSEEGRLRSLASEWGLSVRFCGAVAYRDLPSLYASNDIYVNSSNVDNFPGALVEAACAGLPIVTTGAGGIPWMIRNRESGIVVSVNAETALAAGVIEILEHAELGRRFARQARNWAEQFSWTNVFPRLLVSYGSSAAPVNAPLSGTEVLTR